MTENAELAQLALLADQQRDAELVVEEKEKELALAKKRLREINEGTLPALMDELGLETFTTQSGLKISIKEAIRASIAKKNQAAAMAWLRQHGHEKLIKHKIEVNPSNPNEAEMIVKMLEEFSFNDNESVHAQTLAKFVREKLEAGEDIPQELFGVYRQRISKISVG